MAELRVYADNTNPRIYFPLVDFGNTDYEAGVTIAAGDAKYSIDGGAWNNIVGESSDDLFLAELEGVYSIKLDAAELTGKVIKFKIVDQTNPKEWEDQMVIVETYGNASAMHPNIGITMRGTDSAALASILGAAVGASISADIAAVKAQTGAIETDTGEIGTAGAGLTDLGGMSTGMKAEVQVEANDALVANNLDHLMKEPTSNSATLPEVIDDTVLANILTKTDGDTSDYDFTTDSLEAIRDSQVTMGAGAITFTYSLYEDEDAAPADPIAGVTAWLTTDEAGTNVVAGPGTTNASGAVVFYVDNNTTYYVWRYKSGWNFTNPDEEAIAD
jgi:hypothetical protein